jgi:UDP-3-O-[3-hydroxymyristoyl] glucosamine N-acyltransferase
MELAYTLAQLTEIVSPQATKGSIEGPITGIAALQDAQAGDLSFLGNAKYKSQVAETRASVVLLPADYEGEPAEGQVFLLVEQPSAALALVCARIEQSLWPRPEPGVHASAVVDPAATVDPTATVGPLCVVEAGAFIGAGTHLHAQVFVGRDARIGRDCWLAAGAHVANSCVLGDRVRLHGGVIVGSDGFGYEVVDGRHAKVPQVGIVEVRDDVEIGANSTLDRARFSRTVIGQGTKIDNLVQVAHNVTTGEHCILCAQVGISGSTTLGNYVVLGGQVGVAGHIQVADGTKAGGKAGITTDTEAGAFLNGNPAMSYMLQRRIIVLQRRLPELFKQVENLVNELQELKKASAE